MTYQVQPTIYPYPYARRYAPNAPQTAYYTPLVTYTPQFWVQLGAAIGIVVISAIANWGVQKLLPKL